LENRLQGRFSLLAGGSYFPYEVCLWQNTAAVYWFSNNLLGLSEIKNLASVGFFLL
jgi:hypothetical protein